MFRRQHLLASLSVALVTSVLAAGCSEEVQSTPRVAFDSSVVPGTNPTSECPEKGTWFTIGNFGTPAAGREDPNDPESPLKFPVVPVDDGGEDQQGKVSISCSVVESGEGFTVRASAQLSGATGGSVSVSGFMNRAGDSPGMTLSLTRSGTTYSSSQCVAKLDTTVGQAVAGGRVWASIDCPKAEAPSLQRTCATWAQFRFENCTQ